MFFDKAKKIKMIAIGTLFLFASVVTPVLEVKAVNVPVVYVASNAGYTNVQTLYIYGTADVGSTITINIDNADIPYTVTTDAYGHFSYTSLTALAAGIHTVTAKETLSGTTSVSSSAAKVTIDLTPPAAPAIDSSINGLLTNNQLPVIFGTAEAGSRITINIDGTDYADVATTNGTSGTGKWSYTVANALPSGNHTITAKAKDLANNVGSYSTSATISIDITPPSVPVLTKPTNGSIYNTNKAQVISGTAEPNSKISIKIDSAELTDIVKADSYGMWSFTPAITYNEGVHSICARAKDPAGNVGDYSEASQFTIDTTPPSVPVVTRPLNDMITNNQRPVIIGTAEPNANLLINIDGKDIAGVTPVDILGNWSYTPDNNLSDGVHKYIVKVSDAAGNVSSDRSFNITIDSIKPDLPVITSPLEDSTILQRVTITGTGEKSGKVVLKLDSTPIDDVINIDKSGNWKYTFSDNLSKGFHRVYVRVKDAAENLSDEAMVSFKTVVSFPLVKPVINKPLNNAILNSAKPLITGTAEPGAKIIISVDGKDLVDSITTDSAGNWSMRPSMPLADGDMEIGVKAISAIYKTETKCDPITISIDTVAPITPTMEVPVNNSVIKGNKLSISGMAEPESTIIVLVDNKEGTTLTYKTKASLLGSWSLKASTSFSPGNYIIAVYAKDAAGNKSKLSQFTTVSFKKK